MFNFLSVVVLTLCTQYVEKKKVLQTLSFCLWPTCFKNKAQSSKFSGDKFAKYMHGPLFQHSDNCFDFFLKEILAKIFSYFYFISYLNF